MKSKAQNIFNSLIMIVAIILILIGAAIAIYIISILGLILILVMIIIRGYHIRKMNQEIRDIKEDTSNEIDDTEV
jgi:hypothetical protein